MPSAIDYAEAQLGVQYQFGAEDPGNAFDCSGLVQYAYGKAGVKLPRTADQQYHATQRISYKDARPGDLVYFLDDNGHAYHTGIYLGNGKFLEAPHTGSEVKIASVNVKNVVFGRVPGAKGTAGAGAAASVASTPDDYQSYGYVQDLANSVPEIKTLLKQASAGGWTADRFQDELQTTTWWKTHSDSAKKMLALSKADPAEYKQEQTQAQAHVKQMAAQLGVTLSSAQISSLASADLVQGLDDPTLQSQIGAMYKSGSAQGGTSVQLSQQIQQLAAQYGVPVTQGWVDGQVKTALTNSTGIEGATQQLMKMASSAYPTLAAQIAAGQTVQDIAQPYVAQMSQLLEIPDTNIKMTDPTIQKALTGQLPSSAPPPAAKAGTVAPPAAPTTLYDFQNALRSDPRWQSTDNAKQSAYSLLHGLGQTFGFAS